MGFVWTGMLLLAVLTAVLQGNTGGLTAAAMEGAQKGIDLCLSLAGAMCLWSAVAKAMEQSGLIGGLGRVMGPLLRRLFPKSAADARTMGYLTANVSANLLGLGNAATPMGMKAVQRMQQRSGGTAATEEMCLLIVMNTASVQLLPTTVASVRAGLGAAQPFDILPAVWISSLCSVSVGILAAKLMGRRSRA